MNTNASGNYSALLKWRVDKKIAELENRKASLKNELRRIDSRLYDLSCTPFLLVANSKENY